MTSRDALAVVKRTIVQCMDGSAEDCTLASALLCYLHYQDVVSNSQLFMGFQRVHAVRTGDWGIMN